MQELHNLILYNILEMAKLSHLLLLHCWSKDSEFLKESYLFKTIII